MGGPEPAGQYTITTDGKVRKLFDQTTGHRAHSPNGEWIAVMAGCAIRNFRTGELTVISPEGSDHQTWETDNNWYCTSSGRYLRRVVAFGSPTTATAGGAQLGPEALDLLDRGPPRDERRRHEARATPRA